MPLRRSCIRAKRWPAQARSKIREAAEGDTSIPGAFDELLRANGEVD